MSRELHRTQRHGDGRLCRVDHGNAERIFLDLIILGGRVGSTDVFEADVAITGETIAAVGRGLPPAKRFADMDRSGTEFRSKAAVTVDRAR